MHKISKFLILLIAISFLVHIIETPSIVSGQSSYSIPTWIRNVSGSWSHGQGTDKDFVNGLQFMIQSKILKSKSIQNLNTGSQKIPTWIRNVAGWWTSGQITDDEFVNGVQWLIDNNILVVPQIQQSQSMTSRLISTFAPRLDYSLLAVLDSHKTDYGSSFRIGNLQVYDSQQRILLGFSSDSVNSAIQQAGNSIAQIQYIGYDNEPNNGNLSSPPNEVSNPAMFTNQLADTVHNAGFKYAITPSRDLLQAEYQGVDWTKVDLITIQMQRITGNETSYYTYLDPIVSFIKTKNPNVLILVQVNPQFDSVSHIASVIDNTSGIDGVSIVVTSAPTDQIDSLITALGR